MKSVFNLVRDKNMSQMYCNWRLTAFRDYSMESKSKEEEEEEKQMIKSSKTTFNLNEKK